MIVNFVTAYINACIEDKGAKRFSKPLVDIFTVFESVGSGKITTKRRIEETKLYLKSTTVKLQRCERMLFVLARL